MQAYKNHFSDKNFVFSFLAGIVLLAASLAVQLVASGYANRAASVPVTDIVLSNTRVYDVDGIFVWGAIILVAFSIAVALWRINYMPFALKSVAVFVLIRAVFVSLTHISPFPTHVLMDSGFPGYRLFNAIFGSDDLFFSGHTGLPFLFALMVWDKDRILRLIFLGFSALMAVVVLLGHIHYSIDVLSAFFITFTIFQICKFLFKKDWELFKGD